MSKLTALFLLFILVAIPLQSQQATPGQDEYLGLGRERFLEEMKKRFPAPLYQDETPEHRKARLGTAEDPGPDPDPKTIWTRFGKTYTIAKFPRVNASYKGQPPGWVRPMWNVNIPAEIYQETLEHVWVWIETPSMDLSRYSPEVREFFGGDPDQAVVRKKIEGASEEAAAGDFRNAPYTTYTPETIKFVQQVKLEFSEVVPPASGVTLRFEEASSGLPPGGSWRNGLAVGDMNEDGHADLVVPPQRGGIDSTTPFIFLGDGKGNWTLWSSVRWPRSYNYGTVAVGDLNRDGHLDVVVAAHLTGVFAALGDGKGNFRDASAGLATDFATRRAAIADADGDGDLDIFAITEGPVLGAQTNVSSPLRVFLNDGSASWSQVEIADARRQVAGDWITVGDFDGNRRADVAGASVFFHGTDLFYLQQKDKSWKPFGRGWLPFYSYYSALTSGKFTTSKRDDVIMSFGRFWPPNANPEQITAPDIQAIAGIERVSFDAKGNPRREPIARWESRKPVAAMAHGDFDGDGHRDLVYWRADARAVFFLLGDGKGKFRSAESEGISLPVNTTYDVTVADVNGDGRDDLVFMFEKAERVPDGSIRVWLGRGSKRG